MNAQQQQQLIDVNRKYDLLLQQLTAKYNADIAAVRRAFWSSIVKRNMINNLTTSYNTALRVLADKRKAELDALLKQFATQNTVASQNAVTAQNAVTQNATTTQAPTPAPKKRALIVGINYIGASYQLDGCINDAQELQTWLRESQKFDTITLITDNTALKPVKATILAEFRKLLQSANKGDTLFFSYSGHGSQVFDTSGDEKDGRDETIFVLDGQNITDDELKAIADQEMKDGVTLIALFDSCHSGSMLDLKFTYLDSTSAGGASDTQNAKNTECKGTVLCLTGCTDAQTSSEAWTGSKTQGAMTVCFLETMKNQKSVTWRQLVTAMRSMLQDAAFTQQPQFSSDSAFNLDSVVVI